MENAESMDNKIKLVSNCGLWFPSFSFKCGPRVSVWPVKSYDTSALREHVLIDPFMYKDKWPNGLTSFKFLMKVRFSVSIYSHDFVSFFFFLKGLLQ